MKPYLLPLAAAALMALSGCGQSKPEVVGGPADPQAEALAKAKPVKLPPAVKTSKSYRCKDNSLIFVDFLSDDISANLRTEKTGAPTALTAPAPGEAFKAAGGYEITGGGSKISVTLPGKSKQSCTA